MTFLRICGPLVSLGVVLLILLEVSTPEAQTVGASDADNIRPQAASPLPPRDTGRAASGTLSGSGMITGRVVDAVSGRPVARVEVAARPTDVGGFRFEEMSTATTDEEGRYVLRDMVAAHYRISADRRGYVAATYGQRRPLDASQLVEVTRGAAVALDDLPLFQAGMLSGHVLDSAGEPVPEVTVEAFIPQYRNGMPTWRVVGQAVNDTDDLGAFVIGRLPPGEFLLAVSTGRGRSGGTVPFVTTYYPGVPDTSMAMPVRVAAGEETGGIVIPMLESRMAAMSGRVLDSAGRPVAATVQLTRRYMSLTIGTFNDEPSGVFAFPMLSPGEYRVGATVSEPGAARQTAVVDVTLTGEDVTGILLMLRPHPTVRGRIRLLDDSGALRSGDVRLRGSLHDPMTWVGLELALAPDWSFEGTVAPGYAWSFRPALPLPWIVESV